MKRLIKHAENINTFDAVDIRHKTEDTESMENMIQLDELSEADIRHERCPICKYNPLKRDDGFKVCPRCENMYKVIDGDGFMIVTD